MSKLDRGAETEGLVLGARALSDPIRLRILDILAAGRVEACCSPLDPDNPGGICSCDLQPLLGLQASRLSYHLKELKAAGLIAERKKGRWIYYSLERSGLESFAGLLGRRFLAPEARTPACGGQACEATAP